jgi:hypothetical protein
MKNKRELDYNSKSELVGMIVRLWIDVPDQIKRQKLMTFLLTNYRGFDLSTVDTLNAMPYDELEQMYNAMIFIINT